MKILRFLGFFGILCAFVFSAQTTYAGSTSTVGDDQLECSNGICQVCEEGKSGDCTNICDSGYWGIGGDMSECTLCTTNPGGGFNNTLFGAYTFNRTIGTCYKYCATGSCTDISDPNHSAWSGYGLSGISITPFDSEAGTRTIGFYQFNSNPGGACNTGTDYCPIIMRCSGTSSACKPQTNPVVFKDGNTTLGTLYVVRQTMWSSQNTNFQDDMNTASYSGVVFPIFQAPDAPEKSGYDFKGYYTEPTGGTQIISADGQLTQSNAALAEVQGTLYAQYESKGSVTTVKCDCGYYLPAGATTNADCRICPAGSYCPGGTWDAAPYTTDMLVYSCAGATLCDTATSNPGACNFTECYTSCTTNCISPNSNCPTYPTIPAQCGYQITQVPGIAHLWDKSGCDVTCETETMCPVTSCPENYWYANNVCKPCDNTYTQPNNLNSGGAETCKKNCTVPCDPALPMEGCPEHATCTIDPNSNVQYGTENQTNPGVCYNYQTPPEEIRPSACGVTNIECNTGYVWDYEHKTCAPKKYNVKYTCGDGNGNPTIDTAEYDQPYTVLQLAQTSCTAPAGGEFVGWAFSDGTPYSGGDLINPWQYDINDPVFVAQWAPSYIVRCPDLHDPNTMYQLAALFYGESTTLSEADMNKACYHTCPENQEQDGWDMYLNDPEVLLSGSPFQNPITITGGDHSSANPITLRPHCVPSATRATYLCYKNDEGKVDTQVTLLNYAVRPLSWYHQCNINQNDFNEWLFSGDDALHAAGSTISPWTYGANETFVPAYEASFNCNTTHWQAPSGGNHSTQRVILGDGLSMPAMNCEPRSEYANWLPASPDWTSAYATGLTSPVPGATCNGDISVAGGSNFSWSCPTDLTFTPNDDLITQTLNLSCGSTNGQITVSYGDDISAMVTQWFSANCHGEPCEYPTNPTTYAHGYWKICADWNGVTPPGLTPVDGESGCYKTEPAHPNYDFSQLDPYWNQIDNFSVVAMSRCPKWVKYKCTADSEALYQDNMSYAAYYEEPYTVLDHETVGCGDSGYAFAGWYKEGQPSVEYNENETVQSWPYDDVVILVGKNGEANDYDIIYHSLGGDDMNSSSLCQHTFTYSANAQDFDPDISECIPTREYSTFLGWCASSDTTGCTPIEQIPAGQNTDLNLYAIWECILPYHSNPTGTACVSCENNLFWNGTSCQPCPTSFPHSKQPFNWSEKTCYRECPSNTVLGAAGQTCNTNADLYGLTCTEDVDFTNFTGSSGKQIEFKGNYDANLNTCNDSANTYCPHGLFGCGNMASPFKPMTAPVNFYDATGQQNFGSRFIFGSRGGGDTIDLGSGYLWSFLAGPGQKSDVLHNNVGGVMMDYQYTHIIYPTYVAPEADNISGSAFEGYYYPRTNGTQYVDDDLALNHTNAQTVLGGPSGDSNTARNLYANYSNIEYSVTYSCGGNDYGTPPAPVNGILYNSQFTPAANTSCSNPGHEFGGWVVSNSGDVRQPGTPFTWQYTEDKVFTADWGTSIEYHINYELYGGTASNTGMPTTYTYESGATIDGVPTRDNSIFDGWCTDSTLQNCAMTQTLFHETGDKTFYARWRCESGYTLNNNLCDANTITLVYNNGGHGIAPTEPSSCTYGLTFTLPAAIVPDPADGYTFNKWTVNGGNFGASAPIACDYTNLGIYQGTATITATWGTNSIIIDWNENNNGGATLPNGSCIYDDDLVLTNAPIYNGYTFNGWLLADGTTYANPSSLMANGCVSTYLGVTSGTSTAITAQWCANCVQPAHGTCTLTPQMNGVCQYTTTCEPGYDIIGEGTATPVCTGHKYTVTYRPNGGTPDADQVQTVEYLSQFTTLGATTFTKTNNILTGWNTVSGGAFTGLETRYSYNVASDTILDAAWGECTCQKGTGVNTCTTSVNNNSCQGTATCEAGYINPNVVCSGTVCNAACSECPAGSISVNNQCVPCTAGTYQFGTQCLPCPDGYISGTGATACTPCDDGYSSNETHTACNPNTITLVYANGGHGTAPEQSTCLYNRTSVLPAAIVPNPSDGYTFNKWTVNSNFFNANAAMVCNYENLGVYNGSVILTATWNAETYLVSFNANGGTGGQTAPVYATYNQAMPSISTMPPVNTGYTFMGWYDNENYLNGVQYYTANGLSARAYDKTTGTTLYAGWHANIITLNFSNGGHGTAPNSKTCTYGGNVTLPTAIVAEGFAFVNWAVAGNTFAASESVVCNQANLGVSSGNVTVTAQWNPNSYKVTYDCGDGNGTPPGQDNATYDADFTPALNTCRYNGHVFAGWLVSNTSGVGGAPDIREENVPFRWLYTESKEFTAQWDVEAYNIVYELNGGTNYPNAPRTYTFGLGARIDGTPTRSNSVFKGWCTDAALQNCAMTQTIGRTETGTKKFYAKWVCTNGAIANATNTACDLCPNAQHAENGQCVDDVIVCDLPDANYATRTWSPTTNAYGPCTVITCAPDYHLVSNTCVKDTRECAVTNGYGTQDWNGTQWGQCVAEICDAGYEIVGNSCEECSNRRQNGEIVVSSYANGCDIASCMYHGQKYILNNNECELICETKSDETGSMAWNESRQKCARTCNKGYKMW